MVRQVQKVAGLLGKDTQQVAKRLVQHAEQMVPRVARVIAQTRKRVLEGKKVPSGDKVFSLFEPQTRAIPRHKGGAAVEFGRQVILDEVEGGIVTRYEILKHPEEHGQAIEAVTHHQEVFARPPRLVAADRGVHSAVTEEKLKAARVKQVAIPFLGKASEERRALERTRTDRAGISVASGHRGKNCEPETRLWLAQEPVSRARGDGTVVGPGGPGEQSAPHRPPLHGITNRTGRSSCLNR